MSYLKIFPQSIIVQMDGAGGFVGKMSYDFEQYGRMLYDDETDVEFQCQWQPHEEWVIRSTVKMHKLTRFSVFMHAMNHYLFEVLQFDPVSQWSKVSATNYEYYFERVYFDMDTQQFKTAKKITAADTTKCPLNLLRKNNGS